MSLLIKNGQVFTNGKLELLDILIEDGKIKKLTKEQANAKKVIDASNKIILPGMIDCHVHFRDPGFPNKEDFLSGSKAAAKGGVTTILDMPNNKPPTIKIKDLNKKRAIAKRKSLVNYGFHFGCSDNNINEIKKLNNVASVKIYLNETTGNLIVNKSTTIAKVLNNAKFVTVHAEDSSLKKIVLIAKKLRKKFYMCHISSKRELKYIRANKKSIFVEVTPHHLFLTKKDRKNMGPFAYMKPILKTKEDQRYLWDALQTGYIDVIASDHAPHTYEEKKKFKPAGVPGVETTVPLLLDSVNKQKIFIQDMVRYVSENPAKIFKIKHKGFIKEGYDADLMIVDMDMKKKIRNQDMATKVKWSPFEYKLIVGWPVMTIVNGNVVYDKGKFFNFKGKEVEFAD